MGDQKKKSTTACNMYIVNSAPHMSQILQAGLDVSALFMKGNAEHASQGNVYYLQSDEGKIIIDEMKFNRLGLSAAFRAFHVALASSLGLSSCTGADSKTLS